MSFSSRYRLFSAGVHLVENVTDRSCSGGLGFGPDPGLAPPRGMMEVLPIELPLPSKWSGIEFDEFFFMVDCYVEEYAAYKFFDSIEAIDFLADLAKLWATLPHEEFIFGGKHKPKLKELVARGMALLILLNGELELWGKRFVSLYINLPSRFDGAVPKHLPRKESVCSG